MELKRFVTNFASQFDETDVEEFSSSTNFKDLEEWSSLIALSIIAMVDEEYDVKIKGDDIRNSATIADLYDIVKARM
jgi:acyl carrier protein